LETTRSLKGRADSGRQHIYCNKECTGLLEWYMWRCLLVTRCLWNFQNYGRNLRAFAHSNVCSLPRPSMHPCWIRARFGEGTRKQWSHGRIQRAPTVPTEFSEFVINGFADVSNSGKDDWARIVLLVLQTETTYAVHKNARCFVPVSNTTWRSDTKAKYSFERNIGLWNMPHRMLLPRDSTLSIPWF